MEQIHSLPDGTKLAVWEERNQAMALSFPLRRGMGVMTLARDVLKDLTSACLGGTVYYAYHSLEHRVMFGAAGDGQPAAVLSDPSDGRGYSAFRLLEWKGELYLFLRARSRNGKSWEIKAVKPLSEREEKTLWGSFAAPPEPVYSISEERLVILAAGKICTWDGKQPAEPGEILHYGTGQKAREAILKLEAENRKQRAQLEALVKNHETRIGEIKRQYDELAAYASQLQQEGKRWREKYYKKH